MGIENAKSSVAEKVRERIVQHGTFRRNEIVGFMNVQNDLELWAAVYEALRKSDLEIKPAIDLETIYAFVMRYLIRCISEDPPSTNIHSGFEAAWDLAAYLKFWGERLPQTADIIQLAEREIAKAFQAGDDGLRNRLETGTLEHVLASPSVRPFFAHWENEPAFKVVWRRASEFAARYAESGAKWP